MTPFVSDPDFTLYVGDVREVLAGLPAESVHCCVTSPPYWGLRDYGCDGQLGLEASPEEYVAGMVGVFREVRRVLRQDGTCWLNIGDSYAGQPQRPAASSLSAQEPQKPSYPSPSSSDSGAPHLRHNSASSASNSSGSSIGPLSTFKQGARDGNRRSRPRPCVGLEAKQLVGIPWRLAFALQADGWYLRSDIIWSKPNPMPESVTDRPTKAHEYLFLLSRSPRYFYDADAIREPAEWARRGDQTVGGGSQSWIQPKAKRDLPRKQDEHENRRYAGFNDRWDTSEANGSAPTSRNKRSVWEIATESYPEAHFATFPQALVEPCIKAGCPQDGTVLDPFMGSGTTALVARRLGRKSIGIELNRKYARLAADRLSQLSLLAEAVA